MQGKVLMISEYYTDWMGFKYINEYSMKSC